MPIVLSRLGKRLRRAPLSQAEVTSRPDRRPPLGPRWQAGELVGSGQLCQLLPRQFRPRRSHWLPDSQQFGRTPPPLRDIIYRIRRVTKHPRASAPSGDLANSVAWLPQIRNCFSEVLDCAKLMEGIDEAVESA